MREFLSKKETADLLGIHVVTLRRWVLEGKIKCYKTTPAKSGRVRFKLSDIMSCIERQKIDNRIKSGE